MQTVNKLNIIIFGLSITSSWGNGHATTFRSLVKALGKRGHTITFFEKDVPWYAGNRDLPDPPFCETLLYQVPQQLRQHASAIEQADLVILGSYVSDAREIATWVNQLSPACFAFYDIDTPVTLAKLERDDFEYLHPEMIPQFDIYLSFSGGPILRTLEKQWGAQRARPLYCSVDPDLYSPEDKPEDEPEDNPDPEDNQQGSYEYTLGYLGTYSDDRQPTVQKLLIDTAAKLDDRQFCVAGPQYPSSIAWPLNVKLIDHVPPHQHRHFYNTQRFTLNVTRQDMLTSGYSPSVRLFEAGACGTPIISDYWKGLDELFDIGQDILIAESTEEAVAHLNLSEQKRRHMAQRIRHKVLNQHTSDHRALELEQYWQETGTKPLSPNLAASQSL